MTDQTPDSPTPGNHDHDHDHHGHDDPLHVHPGEAVDTSTMDPANRALADALRISFMVLAAIMVMVLVGFLASGTRTIDQNHVAVRLL